jgi:lycopene beta-cyclase
MTDALDCDIAILGGGLAGCLIALALAERRPELDVRLIEAGRALGGNHVWSFFDSDVAAADRWLIEPLICHRWQGYDVAFPAHRRTLEAAYNAVESERLDAVVRAKLKPEDIIAATVKACEPNRPNRDSTARHLWHYDVSLEDGCRLKAKQVIDARGPGDLSTLELGWQKFVGISVRIQGGHGLTRPIVMDATVDQIDGYRFVYCLPFDTETVFIEDTYYSDTPDLDVPLIRERIIAYAAAKGWKTNGGGRQETGVLPVVIGGDFEAYWASTGADTAKAGLRAGLFHATTGYSLPDAVRLAAEMPARIDAEGRLFANRSYSHAARLWAKRGFYRMLDTMLFHAAEPELRYKVLERFYRLSPALIGRFYAGQSTLADKIRVLSGKPPVPIGRAVRALLGKRSQGRIL